MNKIYKNKEELIKTVIRPGDVVLDVGFWGQGVSIDEPNWPHNLIKKTGADVYALDLDFDESRVGPREKYFKLSAEDFSIPRDFDVIFAGDLIEHLSNPGLFLRAAKAHLKGGGRLIMTTPNCFNLFNMTEKLTKKEPTTNIDHTCYFNSKTLRQLLGKNGFDDVSFDFVYTLGYKHKESWKKKLLNLVYGALARITPKYVETLVVTARN